MSQSSSSDPSPTSSLGRVFLTIAISLVLALIVDARSIVHAGAGMPDGPVRTATLTIGYGVLHVAEATHLVWPRDQLDAALGRRYQPATPPLLASAEAPGSQFGADETGMPPSRPEPTPTTAPTATSVPTATPTVMPTSEAVAAVAPQAPAATVSPTATPTSVPTPKPSPTPTPTATPTPSLRKPTVAQPLRLLVTGDSLSGYLGPILVDAAVAAGPVHGYVDTHNGTGLTRPDFVDWSVVAKQQVASDNPDAVVVFIGGNDFQNMTVADGKVLIAGTPEWTAEYQRRAAICMGIWTQSGARRVYWLSMPPARNPDWAAIDGQIDVALQRAATTVPGAKYLDVLGPVTDHGKYADFVKDDSGRPVLVREADGVHLNITGSTIVANEVLPVIEQDWHFGNLTPTPAPHAP